MLKPGAGAFEFRPFFVDLFLSLSQLRQVPDIESGVSGPLRGDQVSYREAHRHTHKNGNGCRTRSANHCHWESLVKECRTTVEPTDDQPIRPISAGSPRERLSLTFVAGLCEVGDGLPRE